MSIAQQLFNESFSPALQSKRSPAYLSGVLDTLQFRETGKRINNPFALGTAEADAWVFGNRNGFEIYRDYLAQGVVL